MPVSTCFLLTFSERNLLFYSPSSCKVQYFSAVSEGCLSSDEFVGPLSKLFNMGNFS